MNPRPDVSARLVSADLKAEDEVIRFSGDR